MVHDLLCPHYEDRASRVFFNCQCDLIARVRADEQEQWATHEAVQSSHIGMLREATHAEAVAARLALIICEQESDADRRVDRMILRGIRMRDESLADLRAQIAADIEAAMTHGHYSGAEYNAGLTDAARIARGES